MRKNILVLVALVVLSIGSYLFSDRSFPDLNIALLLLFGFIKVFLVVYYFMELKKAHRAWLIIISLIVLTFMGLVIGI